jgi:VWFA-related protein
VRWWGVALLLTASTGHALLPAQAGPIAQGPVYSTRVETVRVDVLVTEGGRPVRGLQPSDFEITDNGVPQRVEFASFEQIPLNVILVLDMSSSVRGEALGHLRAAGASMLSALQPADRAALITFGHAVSLSQRLTSDHARLRAALDRQEGEGETPLVDAAFAGILLGESDVGRALVIVFSDGLDTSSWLAPDAVLHTARRADVVVYGVTVNARQADPFLEELAHLTGGASYEVASTRDLDQVFTRVLEEFRQRYLLGYSPQGVSKDGWHRLEVRVKGRRASTKARPGYLAGWATPQ